MIGPDGVTQIFLVSKCKYIYIYNQILHVCSTVMGPDLKFATVRIVIIFITLLTLCTRSLCNFCETKRDLSSNTRTPVCSWNEPSQIHQWISTTCRLYRIVSYHNYLPSHSFIHLLSQRFFAEMIFGSGEFVVQIMNVNSEQNGTERQEPDE